MTFDWTEYLNIARYLKKQAGTNCNQEAAYRCGVSRSYFSAYCYALNYAHLQQGFQPEKKSEDHGRLRDHFKDKGMLDIARELDELRQWRNKCDYDDEVLNIKDMITHSILEAEDVFEQLK